MPDTQTQYRSAAHVPLIQSPSLQIPQPVAMPQDIHPLPDTLEPYMVYNFTLEQRTLAAHSHLLGSLSALQATHAERLRAWEAEKARRRREALRRVAPGFEPEDGVLVPTRAGREGGVGGTGAGTGGAGGEGSWQGDAAGKRESSVMEDLVAGLERMGYGEGGR